MFQDFTTELIVFIFCVASIVLLLCLFIIIAVYRYQRNRLLYTKEIKELRANFENSILSTKIEIQEQTFEQISQEIHDNIGQKLTLAKLYLNTISKECKNEARDKIHLSLGLISESLSRLRELSKGLSANYLLHNGLVRAIDCEVELLNSTGVVKANFDVIGEEIYLSDKTELIIFRIVQECINNFIKHSKGFKLGIQLSYFQNEITISVNDDGIGISNSNNNGLGLMNMRKRAELLGGTFNILTNNGKGTKIIIKIPTVLK